MGLPCCLVGHRVTHHTDVGRNPLKVDGIARGGEVKEEGMNGKTKGVVCVWAVALNELEGREGVSEESDWARRGDCGGIPKALSQGRLSHLSRFVCLHFYKPVFSCFPKLLVDNNLCICARVCYVPVCG